MAPPHLPPAVCWEILVLLPAKYLIRFRAVCKAWRSVIEDPFFVKAHIDKQQVSSKSKTLIIRASPGPPFSPLFSLDLDALNFTDGLQPISVRPLDFTPSGLAQLPVLPVALCNGLMLVAPLNPQLGTWEIWNPLTQERLNLPQIWGNNNSNSQSRVLGVGIGYDYAADDYKAVVAIDMSCKQTFVYSLKLDSWKDVGSCPFAFESLSDDNRHGVFLNGSLHWVSESDDIVIVFDVVTENFSQLPLPLFKRRPESMHLDALSGCLFLSCVNEFHKRGIVVWVMNDDSWMRMFGLDKYDLSSLPHLINLRLVAFMKNESLVLLHHNCGFLWFDYERKSLKIVSIHGVSIKISAQICVGSLFRLHDSCGRSNTTRTMMNMAAQTKLHFCLKDRHRFFSRSSHDDGCGFDSNLYNSSCESNELTFNPQVAISSTLTVPIDICREIFLCLPPKSVVRFRAMSKAHRAVIDDQFFVRSYTNRQLASNNTVIIRNSTGAPSNPLYFFNLEDLNFTDGQQTIAVTPLDFPHSGLQFFPSLPAAACNGLILCAGRKNWEIWNPSTDERLELPRGDDFHFNPTTTGIGLGYDYTTNDYKAVVIDHRRRRREKEVYRTHVYSLKSDSWSKKIWNCPFPRGPGVFVCGALNWLSTPRRGKKLEVTVFDLGTESYRQLQLPPPLREYEVNYYNRKLCLDVLGGCLILSDCSAEARENCYFDVWVMKVYGDDDSWVKLFSINENLESLNDSGCNLKVVAEMKNKTQFLLQEQWGGFFLFDVVSNSMKKVGIHGLTENLYAQSIPRSIFRLHDNCGVSGTRKTRTVKRESRMFSDSELNFCVTDDLSRDSHDNCYS